jgi:hypothetical protein
MFVIISTLFCLVILNQSNLSNILLNDPKYLDRVAQIDSMGHNDFSEYLENLVKVKKI